MTETVKNYLSDVRKQYEEFPYPERNPKDEQARLVSSYMSRLDAVNHHGFKGEQDFKNFRVLVAGGGTGDNLILWAEQLRDKEGSSVVYLDMSAASSEIAKKRSKKRKLENITWVCDSLLNVPDLKLGQFDLIECSGVLHHLEDPDTGLKALTSVLKSTGVMNLMVYGTYGRFAVYMIQNLMRLVNGDEENPRKKIENTKKILEILPPAHWFNISKHLGLSYLDSNNDAGIYDLFLHSQDKPFTILEVHDWLERCELQMASEPGSCNNQLKYLPETYIKDENVLAMIKKRPLKVQQAIAESISTHIGNHEFYAVHKGTPETVAKIADTSLIPWAGMNSYISFEQLAATTLQQKGAAFSLKFDNIPAQPQILVPAGEFVAGILRRIDGQRTVGEIVNDIRSDKKYGDTPPDEAAVMKCFEDLFISLNRASVAFLRHKSVEPFANIHEMQERMEKYK